MTPQECRPAKLPGLRDDAIRSLRWDARHRAAARGHAELGDNDGRALAMLETADLYWVSEDMSELCRDATSELTEAHLGRDLWPSESGFMVFATPVAVDGHAWLNANDQALEPVRALVWYPDGQELTVLLFVDMTAMVEATLLRVHGVIDEQRRRQQMDALTADSGMRWVAPASGDSYLVTRPFTLAEHAGPGCPAGFMLSTVWMLMSQRGLASVTTGVPAPRNKAARRRLAAVQPQLDALRLVELRAGTDHARAYSGTAREYRHRWMVRGHWRQQWYPSVGMTRPVWIAPHLKGPEGAPVLTGQKVHVWKGR